MVPGIPVICTDVEAYRGHFPCTRIYSNSTEEQLAAIRYTWLILMPVIAWGMRCMLRESVMRKYMPRVDNLRHWLRNWLAD